MSDHPTTPCQHTKAVPEWDDYGYADLWCPECGAIGGLRGDFAPLSDATWTLPESANLISAALSLASAIATQFQYAGHPSCPTCNYSFDAGDQEHEADCPLDAFLKAKAESEKEGEPHE